ncbi:MAG: hypothetical protein JNM78_06505 [Cyclobacteriaceae bacterium]|nr:hypothetical protein [Cyclobacteriaceae bacterium]
MKNSVVLFLISVMMVTMAFTKEELPSIKVLSTKRHILYFKSSREMIGATIEVQNERHQLVATEQVEETKTIIDFFYLPPGAYTVKVKKGEVEVDIEYINE